MRLVIVYFFALLLSFNSCTENNTHSSNAGENNKSEFTQKDFNQFFIKYFNDHRQSLSVPKPITGEIDCEIVKTTLGDLNNDNLNDAVIEYDFIGDYGNATFSEIGVVTNQNGQLKVNVLESKIKGTGKGVDLITDKGILQISRHEWAEGDSHAGGPSIGYVEQYRLADNKLVFVKSISKTKNGVVTTGESLSKPSDESSYEDESNYKDGLETSPSKEQPNAQNKLKFSVVKSLLMGTTKSEMERVLGTPSETWKVYNGNRYLYFFSVIDDVSNETCHVAVTWKVTVNGASITEVDMYKAGDNIPMGFGQYIKSPK